MFRRILTVALFFGAMSAHADLSWELKCTPDNPTASGDVYKVVKKAAKVGRKWENTFYVVQSKAGTGEPVEWILREASGDEGYLVYKTVSNESPVADWITIGNGFKWAEFATEEDDYRCE